MEKIPHTSTSSRILKKSEAIKRKKGRLSICLEFENEMVSWIWYIFLKTIFVSDEMIRVKSQQYLSEINLKNSPENEILLKVTNCWLQKFMIRNKFKRYYSNEESIDLTIKNLVVKLPEILHKLSKYSINDTFNADEFRLFTNYLRYLKLDLEACRGEERQKNV